MLYGNINNEFFSVQLKLLPAPLASALKFLKDNDLTKHEPGKFDIELDGVKMIRNSQEVYRCTVFMFRRPGERSVL